MIVNQIPVGSMQNFTYILYDDTHNAVVLDPSWDLDKIHTALDKLDLELKYIINTHNHFDHTIGNESLAKSTNAKIIQHQVSELKNDITVSNNDVIEFGNSKLDVLYTPGHSLDSICLVDDEYLFSGDTLFVGSCGRTDLPGGDPKQLYTSLFDVLYDLKDSLIMYPGHDYGSSKYATLFEQKQSNPIFQRRTLEEFLMLFA